MSDNDKNEVTVFDQVKHELDIQRDPMEFKVPLSDIFGTVIHNGCGNTLI